MNNLGYKLLSDTGSPIQLKTSNPEMLADGTILENGVPVARLGLASADQAALADQGGGSTFRILPADYRPIQDGIVRQGMLEGSNVESAQEMIELMTAMRRAETGSKLVQMYDTLVGQAITVLGRAGR